MRKILINIIVLLLLTTVEIVRADYSPDIGLLIKRMHGTTHAKSFLDGCLTEPYIMWINNYELVEQTRDSEESHNWIKSDESEEWGESEESGEPEESGELEKLEESDLFKLKKAREYLFAVFTTQKFSIIISNTNATDGDKRFVQFNITLGINKNSMAMLEMNVNNTIIGNDTEEMAPLLPTIPYYVNVSITEKNISVYEARTNATVPFLSLNYDRNSTGNMTNEDDFFVKFVHLSSIVAHFDCCEACSPWIYTRISGCSKYSSRTARIKSEKTFSLADMISSNLPENILFSQNILINHDGGPTFSARIVFAENDNFRGNQYEIGLSDHPTIMHYFNSSTRHTERGPYFKKAYTTPFIVNITITKDGVIRLRLPYEKNEFLVYIARHEQLKPVDVKYMKMVKFHEDINRYDFYFNCTEIRCFSESEPPNYSDYPMYSGLIYYRGNHYSYPLISIYPSMQYKKFKYDVLHIFQDFYQIYDKFPNRKYEYDSDYKTQASPTNDSIPQPENKDSGIGKAALKLLQKAAVGVGSFLCIGFLKFIFTFDCVKNCLKEIDVDDEDAKNLRKSASNAVSKNMADSFGLELDE